jgi:hypothetical protein
MRNKAETSIQYRASSIKEINSRDTNQKEVRMGVPKKKRSKSRRGSRQSQQKLSSP